MELLPGVALVGSGWLGMSLSDRDDCHVYLVHDGDDAILIDAGCGRASDAIVQRIQAVGVAPQSVSRILITHAHPDHAAGALSLAERLGATVLASPQVADILRRGDEDGAGLTVARAAGRYPTDVRLLPTPATSCDDGDVLQVGSITVQVLATPGHAIGHLCYVARLDVDPLGCKGGSVAVLFSGDLVFTRGRVAVLGTPDTDVAALADSLRRVAALRPQVLLPGHETVALSDAPRHLDAAISALDLQDLPPALLP